MKRFLTLTVCVFMLCALLAGCAVEKGAVSSLVGKDNSSVVSADEKGEYKAGTVTTTEWSSEWIGLKYSLNDNMVMSTSEELEQAMQIGADYLYEDSKTGQQLIDYAKITTVYEMMATNITDSSNIIVAAEKLSLTNITIEQYISALKAQFASTQVQPNFGEATDTTIAGMDFKQLDGAVVTNGVTVHQRYLITKIENRAIVIITSATNTDAIDTLLSGFSAI